MPSWSRIGVRLLPEPMLVIISWNFKQITEYFSEGNVFESVSQMLAMLFRPQHDDVIKWKHFPHYRPFVQGIHWSQRPVTRSFDVFFDLCLNKQLSKQSRHWWFEMPSHSLGRHCNGFNLKSDGVTFLLHWLINSFHISLLWCLKWITKHFLDSRNMTKCWSYSTNFWPKFCHRPPAHNPLKTDWRIWLSASHRGKLGITIYASILLNKNQFTPTHSIIPWDWKKCMRVWFIYSLNTGTSLHWPEM